MQEPEEIEQTSCNLSSINKNEVSEHQVKNELTDQEENAPGNFWTDDKAKQLLIHALGLWDWSQIKVDALQNYYRSVEREANKINFKKICNLDKNTFKEAREHYKF